MFSNIQILELQYEPKYCAYLLRIAHLNYKTFIYRYSNVSALKAINFTFFSVLSIIQKYSEVISVFLKYISLPFLESDSHAQQG